MADEDQRGEQEMLRVPLDAAPGLARLAVGAWLRGASWGVSGTLRAGRRLTEAARSGESANELFEELRDEAVDNARRMLGVAGRADLIDSMPGVRPAARPETADRSASLRARGAALLDRAADVSLGEQGIHPGFDRIVDQLSPDEARLLRLLYNEGAQAIVYVNKAGPLGIGAREVARRLTLAGQEAGCLHPEMVAAYLDNLVRLGLVAIRRDPIPSEAPYLVLEAQPAVVEALKRAKGRILTGRTARHSIHLTDYGRGFCDVCFPPEALTGEFEAVGAVGKPVESADDDQTAPAASPGA